jgi:hypothetical protein
VAVRVAHIGRRGLHIGFLCESEKEQGHYEDPNGGVRIILKWYIEKLDEVVLTGFILLRIGTSGGLHKCLGNS